MGSGSPAGAAVDCANRSDAEGKRLKLTIKAPVPLRNCLRESSAVVIWIAPSSNRLARRALHRTQDARVGAAAAEIARQRLFDLAVRRLGILIQ